MTINSGPGSSTDWIALYPIGAADAAYLDWKYLSGSAAPPSTGLTAAILVQLLPVTPGDYEIRLFANNSYQRLAVSPTVTVAASMTTIAINGVAAPTVLAVSAGTVLALGSRERSEERHGLDRPVSGRRRRRRVSRLAICPPAASGTKYMCPSGWTWVDQHDRISTPGRSDGSHFFTYSKDVYDHVGDRQ